jgi:hypothetical protein
MNRRTMGFIALLSVAGGVVGGHLSGPIERGAPAALAGETLQPVKVLAAEELRLVDQSGHLRGRLTTDSKGAAALYLFDAEGKERARLGVFDDLAAVVLTGKTDERGSGLAVLEDGRAELTLHTEGKAMHLPVTSGRHWVLWGQRMPFEVPIGTWSSQDTCEEQRLQRQQTLTSWILSCLPENVEPRRQ